MRTAMLVALVVGLSPSGAGAQQGSDATAADTLDLTLEDVLRVAAGSNPGYRQTVNDLGLNGVETRATWANQILPTARLGLFNTSYTGNVQRIGVDDFGNPTAKDDADWLFRSTTSQSLSLSWNLRGLSVLHARDEQRLTNRSRLLAENAAAADLATRVRREYFEVLEQRALLEMEEELEASRQVELDLARQLFRVAGNTRVDVLQAELQVEQQALSVRQQRTAYEQARLAIRTTMGDAGLGPFRLADEPLPVFDPVSLDVESLTERAVGGNSDVRQARSDVEGRRIGTRQAKNAWWPDLNVSYNVFRRTQEQETNALFDVPLDKDLEQNFTISLGIPLFNDFFGNRRSIEQAEVALDNAEEQLRLTRLQTEEAVRTALLGLRDRHESLRLATRSLEIAREALELAREEYRRGTRTFEQLRQTVDSEADARRQVIAARFGFVDALLTLEEAVGSTVRGAPAP